MNYKSPCAGVVEVAVADIESFCRKQLSQLQNLRKSLDEAKVAKEMRSVCRVGLFKKRKKTREEAIQSLEKPYKEFRAHGYDYGDWTHHKFSAEYILEDVLLLCEASTRKPTRVGGNERTVFLTADAIRCIKDLKREEADGPRCSKD